LLFVWVGQCGVYEIWGGIWGGVWRRRVVSEENSGEFRGKGKELLK
jgi:hypothetical protein